MEDMKTKSVSLEEQETVINISPMDNVAAVYSCTPHVVKRLLKYVREYPDLCGVTVADGYGVEITMPVEWVSFKPRKKRVVTEEQRAAASERLRKIRQGKS